MDEYCFFFNFTFTATYCFVVKDGNYGIYFYGNRLLSWSSGTENGVKFSFIAVAIAIVSFVDFRFL